MFEGMPVNEVIEARRSVRSYADRPIEPEKLARLNELLAAASREGPLAAASGSALPRYLIVHSARAGARPELSEAAQPDPRGVRVGTYGTINGAEQFIVGIMPKAEKRMELFGYQFEWIVLAATALGLGTCWLGGIFDRDGISAQVPLAGDEFIPIISPLGYASDKPSLADRMLRKSAGSDKRKPWGELFFDRTTDVPLSPGVAGDYRQPLEMVRLGPSASNKQPWRIVRQGNRFDFHLQRTRGYGLPIYDIQRNDIGIAQCHFELSAKALGLAGHWAETAEAAHEGRGRLPGDFEFIASWISEA